MRHHPLHLLVPVVLAACSGGSGKAASPGDDATATTATTVPTTTELAVPPVIEHVDVDMDPDNVLLATLHVTTDTPARLAVSVVEAGRSRALVTTETVATEHTVPIRGLHADRTQTIEVAPLSPDGALSGSAADVDVSTKPLPFSLPEISVGTSQPEQMSPGYTMFDVVQTTDIVVDTEGRAEQPPGILVAVDEQGEVVWYLTHPRPIADARILPDGTLLYESADTEVVFADLDGHVAKRLTTRLYDGTVGNDLPTVEVDTDALHHETNLLPNGHLVSFSTALHTVHVPQPLCGESPSEFTGTYSIISDVVVEVDVTTGAVVSQYDLFDLLDPMSDPARRDICGTAFQGNAVFPVKAYSTAPGRIIDWTHANAVVLDQARNELLVSVRHLNEIIAIRYADDTNGRAGQLLWELGEDGTVPYTGRQFTHQHSVDVLPDGGLILYDNGNEDPEPQQSRAMRIILHGDGQIPTSATEAWEFPSTVDGRPAFSLAVGDADPLPNGNVLITNGFYAVDSVGLNAQLVEVTPEGTQGGTVVWELRVGGPSNWFVYRAERIPSLYPIAV